MWLKTKPLNSWEWNMLSLKWKSPKKDSQFLWMETNSFIACDFCVEQSGNSKFEKKKN